MSFHTQSAPNKSRSLPAKKEKEQKKTISRRRIPRECLTEPSFAIDATDT
jgi:hypothetical protein